VGSARLLALYAAPGNHARLRAAHDAITTIVQAPAAHMGGKTAWQQ
jgi:hypothetical protein